MKSIERLRKVFAQSKVVLLLWFAQKSRKIYMRTFTGDVPSGTDFQND